MNLEAPFLDPGDEDFVLLEFLGHTDFFPLQIKSQSFFFLAVLKYIMDSERAYFFRLYVTVCHSLYVLCFLRSVHYQILLIQ